MHNLAKGLRPRARAPRGLGDVFLHKLLTNRLKRLLCFEGVSVTTVILAPGACGLGLRAALLATTSVAPHPPAAAVAVLQKSPISCYLPYLRARGPLLTSHPFFFCCAICGVGEGHDAPVLGEKLARSTFDRKSTYYVLDNFFESFCRSARYCRYTR